MAKLGEICKINMGQSPNSSTYNVNKEGIPFFQGNADFGKINPTIRVWCSNPVKVAKENDILISVRAPIGALNISDCKCCIGRGLASLTINTDKCIQKFLWYSLINKTYKLISKGTGSTFKAINKQILFNLDIPLPPLEEQQKIAMVLDKVTDIIDKRKQQLTKLDELIKSRFVEMFGDLHNNNIFPYKTIKNFTKVVTGGTPDRKNLTYWKNGEIKWVKTTELKNKIITDTEEKITELGLKNSSAQIVPKNTILIAMYGQGKTRGMTGYLLTEACTNQACACILPSLQINTKYLWQVMIMSYEKIRNLAKGGNQPNLNSELIKNFPILVPPLDLQNQFAEFVEQTEKTKVAINHSLDKLEILKKSLMQKYFG